MANISTLKIKQTEVSCLVGVDLKVQSLQVSTVSVNDYRKKSTKKNKKQNRCAMNVDGL